MKKLDKVLKILIEYMFTTTNKYMTKISLYNFEEIMNWFFIQEKAHACDNIFGLFEKK